MSGKRQLGTRHSPVSLSGSGKRFLRYLGDGGQRAKRLLSSKIAALPNPSHHRPALRLSMGTDNTRRPSRVLRCHFANSRAKSHPGSNVFYNDLVSFNPSARREKIKVSQKARPDLFRSGRVACDGVHGRRGIYRSQSPLICGCPAIPSDAGGAVFERFKRDFVAARE